jgi:hypothetical protein
MNFTLYLSVMHTRVFVRDFGVCLGTLVTGIAQVAHPCGRDLARFMQQRQPLVAAFIHYYFLARVDPERADDIVPVDLSVSETDSSKLVEVSN